MMTEKERRIIESWHAHFDEEASSERMIQMVCDDCNCDASDVIDAVFKAEVVIE